MQPPHPPPPKWRGEEGCGKRGSAAVLLLHAVLAFPPVGLRRRKGGQKASHPLVHSLHGSIRTKIELYSMLKSIPGSRIGFLEVSRAYDAACKHKESCLVKWKKVYERESRDRKDLYVVLLGRPYTILSRFMNKGIPEIFASLGSGFFFRTCCLVQVKKWNRSGSAWTRSTGTTPRKS